MPSLLILKSAYELMVTIMIAVRYTFVSGSQALTLTHWLRPSDSDDNPD